MTVAVRIAAAQRARCSKIRCGMLPVPAPVRRIQEPVDDVVHQRAPARARAHGVRTALEPDEQEVGPEGDADRQDGPDVDLGQEEAVQALGDEEPEAAEALAEDRGDRREADRRHDREPDARP